MLHIKGFFTFLLFLFSCQKKNQVIISDVTRSDVIVFRNELEISKEMVIDKRAIIYPEALIKTKGNGKIIFKKPVNIFGNHQVFDENAEVSFEMHTIASLSPTYFGATGEDQKDDTRAIQKTFDIAMKSNSVIELYFPPGNYYTSSTLILKGNRSYTSIILKGINKTPSGKAGSSIIWNGKSEQPMIEISNISESIISGLDFNSAHNNYSKNNLLIKPFTYKILIENCSFGGSAGSSSANINLNEGNSLQVSEIKFDNCRFRAVVDKNGSQTASAIKGGKGNTKNFYIDFCSFGDYNYRSIDIESSSIVNIQNNTFATNGLDIFCGTCGMTAINNYSEGSDGFFSSSSSTNVTSYTLINNYFTGTPKDGFVIRDGSGNLILIANNFGGSNSEPDFNRIKWEDNIQRYDHIISIGNFFKNGSKEEEVFRNRSNRPTKTKIFGSGDIGGKNGKLKKRINKK